MATFFCQAKKLIKYVVFFTRKYFDIDLGNWNSKAGIIFVVFCRGNLIDLLVNV